MIAEVSTNITNPSTMSTDYNQETSACKQAYVSFQSLSFPPESNQHYSEDLQEKVIRYLGQLNETERKVYMIAKGHLGTSFNIARTTGYRTWLEKNESK